MSRQGYAILGLQIARCKNGESGLEGIKTDFPTYQVLGSTDFGIDVYPDLRVAEEPARKNWNCGELHVTALGHQIRGERDFADIKLTVLEHWPVALRAVP
jgi:hypothetical protein